MPPRQQAGHGRPSGHRRTMAMGVAMVCILSLTCLIFTLSRHDASISRVLHPQPEGCMTRDPLTGINVRCCTPGL